LVFFAILSSEILSSLLKMRYAQFLVIVPSIAKIEALRLPIGTEQVRKQSRGGHTFLAP
jgi:hypothetical protein